ncbi:MAG: hypothetical protein ACI80H_000592 [Pseudoalteromonas distincta]|jgi:hypothetical protein
MILLNYWQRYAKKRFLLQQDMIFSDCVCLEWQIYQEIGKARECKSSMCLD